MQLYVIHTQSFKQMDILLFISF